MHPTFTMINISIDCPPGSTRPGSYFKYIVNEIVGNSNLSQEAKDYINKYADKEKDSVCFGEWTWKLEEPKNNSIREEIISYFRISLTKFHQQGAIRYASFS